MMQRVATHKSYQHFPATDRKRCGAVLVAALVCLTLSTVLLGSLLNAAIRHRKQMRWEEYRLQAEWLAESAVERTADRLADDAEYAGESWKIDATQLDGQHSALVTISIRESANHPGIRTVTVVATYPANAARNTKRTKQVEIQLESQT